MVFCDIGFHKPLNAIIAPKEAQNPAQLEIVLPSLLSRLGFKNQ
jgi:hypothetical protein